MNRPGIGFDANALRSLQASASSDPRAAIAETAKQFEALFMQELMKSMRQASVENGMFDNEGTKMGRELLDVQYAQRLTGLPGGLSEMIARQLERQLGAAGAGPQPGPLSEGEGARRAALAPAAAAGAPAHGPAASRAGPAGHSHAEDFVARHSAAARAVERETGIPSAFILGQAAHESGWGRREIRMPDGSSSHNLFGIKAGAGWKGAVTEVTTTEYIDGQPRKVVERFRAYGSPEEAFRDWARLIGSSPRYAGVMEAGGSAQGFAQNLQRAGYATDPAYADKLGRVINTTLRLQRELSS